MFTLWRVFWGTVILIVIVAVTATFLSYRLLTDALPQTEGTLEIKALQHSVDVYRDQWGVPHIFADNEKDLFFAAGFVTAQDRLWQMDFHRRIASGTLSEILGEVTIEQDKFLRLWGFQRVAQQIADTLSTDSRMMLEAYAAGVNAYIDAHTSTLPAEFSLLNYKPEKWQIEDSIAFARVMAWKLSFSWYVDLVLDQLVAKLGEANAREVFPDFPKNGPFIISPDSKPFWTGQDFLESGLQVQNLLGIHGARLGSNSWVVSGAHTTCGKPMLASDPHLELGTPSIWYEIHLSGGQIDVAGVSLPGAPGIVIGHNQEIAWGLTNGMVDDVDFYFERTNPENPEQYWDGKEWRAFEIITEEIKVKDGEPVECQLKATRSGIVVTDIHPAADKDTVVTMRWVGQIPSDEFAAYHQLMKATDWAQFTDALRHFKVPAQNFTFASTSGDIGYYLAGRVPIRNRTTGILPHRGWEQIGQWTGEIPFEKLPHLLNPPEGYLATANNKIVDDRYPYYLSNLWEPSGRAARIHERLAERDTFTVDDFRSIQNDIESQYARDVMAILRTELPAYIDSVASDSLTTLFDLVKSWRGGVESPDSLAVSIYHAFLIALGENVLKDEMGDTLYSNYVKTSNVPYRVLGDLLRKPSSPWFDDVTTEPIESKQEIMARSLLDAGRLLTRIAGDNISDWRWGKIHTLTMRHPLAAQPPLDTFLNLGPFPRGGSTMTINNSEHPFSEPFASVIGPSTRQIVDLCDLQHTLSVIPTGQSGQRMSEHYDDQTPLWLNGEYHEMVMGRAEIIENAVQHLTLSPALP